MIPRLGKRWASTKSPARKGRKGHLFNANHEHPPTPPVELMRHTKRRIAKAERDERMDITLALTQVKTYMGGFTRPRDLRASNWFPGGRYGKERVYELPPESAYEPHTVFVLESRYLVKHGIGRTDSLEHIVGICREGDFPEIAAMFNSSRATSEALTSMDNARWPWTRQFKIKETRWWAPGEDRAEIVRKMRAGEELEPADGSASRSSESEFPLYSLKPHQPPPAPPSQAREYHTSARDHTKVYVFERREMHTSRPPSAAPKSSRISKDQDDPDAVVPTYYVERKKQRDSIEERKETEGSLMYELNAGVLSNDIAAAQLRTRVEKVPFEVTEMDGTVRHPSGFEPPTPAHEFRTPPFKVPAPNAFTAELDPDEVIPVEVEHPDGTIAHPSGFVPPTPQSMFKREFHSSPRALAEEVHIPNLPILPPDVLEGVDVPVEGQEGVAADVVDADADAEPQEDDASEEAPVTQFPVKELRAQYMPTLRDTPFWRPLISVTVSTRPLALSLARLCRSMPRGLPFYASITNDDRKCHYSFSSRMRNLRLNRLHELSIEMARLLNGERGGFVGMRYCPSDKGRGVDGEGLAEPVPLDKRVMKVGVGEWYPRMQEIKELFNASAQAAGVNAMETFALDEKCNPLDAEGNIVPWPKRPAPQRFRMNDWLPEELKIKSENESRGLEEELANDEEDDEEDDAQALREQYKAAEKKIMFDRRQHNERLQYIAREHPMEVARLLAQRHRSVYMPDNHRLQ
ncbi:hypothetical protein HETIRDRAFT_480544 [Heterobasidion irregulare TC 32-1]|uniref:Uncharacterized protein n=1 Tax=Heterobasidion irregulare (strain TC 32-1) TaxID=747525 RepID=W4JSA1_HETIT|nr:uncharacterized protein HETIRDRAFT_480544 [Heterobasidion irregulare TC 32-1]ETW76418.1 hypothetical protein HETIRDRAFT_480544 [Heterobasidion irregulare TC 32-1]